MGRMVFIRGPYRAAAEGLKRMEQSMKELVEKAVEGDQQAVAVLYERTNRKAYYLALQLVKDQDQAQDILQDAYLKVFTNLGMLQQPENFQGWLDTIVINKSKDYLKKKKPVLFSQMAAKEEADSGPDFEDESGYFSPEKRVDYSETKRLIQEMIDRLPEAQRMAVVLYYLENLPVARIARIMECSEGTVKSRLNYGRKSIKEQVLALEKKGTKLYCMPLVPFLYWMFRQQVLAAAVPGAVGAAVGAAGAGVGNAVGGGAAGAGVGNAVGGGAVGAGNAVGGGVAGAGNTVAGTGVTSAGTATAASAGTASAAASGIGTAGTVAGKAGLTILGKAIGVKGVAIVAAACVGVGAAGGVYTAKSRQAAETAGVEAEREEERSRRAEERKTEETASDRLESRTADAQDDRWKRDEQMKAAWTPEYRRIWEASLCTEPDKRVPGEDLGRELETVSQEGREMIVESGYAIIMWGQQIEKPENYQDGYYIYDKDSVDQIIEECYGHTLEGYIEGTDQTLVQLKNDSYYLSGMDWGASWPYMEIADTEARDGRLIAYGYKGWVTEDEAYADSNYVFDSEKNTWTFKEPLIMYFSWHPEAVYSQFRLEDIQYNRDWKREMENGRSRAEGPEDISQMEEERLREDRPGEVQVSAEQKRVMELLLSPLVYAQHPDNGIVRTVKLSQERIVNLMSYHLNDIMEDPDNSIFAPLADETAHSVEQGLVYQYMEDMYGQPVSMKAVEKELSWDFTFLKLENGRLRVTGAGGESWCGVTLEEFAMEDGKMQAKGYYEIELGDIMLTGDVRAVFEVNPDSFFGYTLELAEIENDGNQDGN